VPKGLLLVNLGTPDAPRTAEVRRYLAEFLSDPRVVDLNPVGRWLLLHGVILRFRPRKSAHAYQQIWTERGSPLLFHSQDLAAGVRARLGAGWTVALGMRYGQPSLAQALGELEAAQCDRLTVLPLYPQYSAAATGSTVEAVLKLVQDRWVTPELDVIGAFYEHPAFVRAFVEVARPVFAAARPDHVLMSFHGVPERHVRKATPSSTWCQQRDGCCDAIRADNRHCYRAQCFATARALARGLGLSDLEWTVGFQSRLGRDPWIKPYTDEILVDLARRGHKRVAVLCPAFVADCLETLEEIGLRGVEAFRAAGGESLTLVPSLNSHPAWVDAVAEIAGARAGARALGGGLGVAADRSPETA
jgi:ferrochelatase